MNREIAYLWGWQFPKLNAYILKFVVEAQSDMMLKRQL